MNRMGVCPWISLYSYTFTMPDMLNNFGHEAVRHARQKQNIGRVGRDAFDKVRRF
jgi:hypothetical protein